MAKLLLRYTAITPYVPGHSTEIQYDYDVLVTRRDRIDRTKNHLHESFDAQKVEVVHQNTSRRFSITIHVPDEDQGREIVEAIETGKVFGFNWSRDLTTFENVIVEGSISQQQLTPDLFEYSFNVIRL